MSCDGPDSVAVIKTDAKRIKDGKLRRYKDKLFGEKWPVTYAVLYQDSTLIWYDDEKERSPRGSLHLKDFVPFLAVGVYCSRLPDRPALPPGARIDHVIAIGTGACKRSKIHWFLCNSDEELTTWMTQIVSTLPPPPAPPQQPQQQAVPNYSRGTNYQPPPSNYGPPPNYGPAPAYPTGQFPAYYPQTTSNPAPHTTVVVAGGAPSYPSGGGGGIGGFGTGMLAGGLIGYGLGSLSTPHWGYGCGYGWGGTVYDNDTTIVNNYNVTNTTNTTTDYNNQLTGNYNGDGGADYEYGRDTGGDYDDGGDF